MALLVAGAVEVGGGVEVAGTVEVDGDADVDGVVEVDGVVGAGFPDGEAVVGEERVPCVFSCPGGLDDADTVEVGLCE